MKDDNVPADHDNSDNSTNSGSTNGTTPTDNSTGKVYPIDHPDDPIFTASRKHGDKIVNSKTPVWGVLTEPLRGSLQVHNGKSYSEYIPASHVKFLE